MKKKLFLFGLFATLAIPSGLWAQQVGYFQTNLVSNTAAVATTTDPQLLNPWGISFIPGQDFWIANNNSGTSTLYDSNGTKDTALVVTIPVATKNPNGNCSIGCPTGNVANGNSIYFGGGQFIFATEDGLIANWTGVSNTAAVAFDNSASGAVYKALTLLNSTTLLAANFNSGKVDVYSSSFTLTSLAGSFTDPNLPAGYAPHGIHVINNQVYVAYAKQDAAKHDAMPGAGLGQVDIFDTNGNFVSTFVAAGGQLNAPWAVVAAPSTFGAFPNAILVGNFGDGIINAFDTTGKFLGQLTDSSNKVLVNPGLWDLVFGGGGTSGAVGTLFLTAGGSNQPNFPAGGSTTSVFAGLIPAAAVTSQNFTLNLSTPSVTVAPGGSTNVTIGAAGVAGFNSPITLSCSLDLRTDLCFQSCDDHTRVEHRIHLVHLCRLDHAARRVSRGDLRRPAARFGYARNRFHDSKTEAAYAQKDFVDETLRVSPGHCSFLMDGRRMREWWQFKYPNAADRISGHFDGNGYFRRNHTVRPANHHDQLKQNSRGKGALQCAFAQYFESQIDLLVKL